jgi:hypothetical protein
MMSCQIRQLTRVSAESLCGRFLPGKSGWLANRNSTRSVRYYNSARPRALAELMNEAVRILIRMREAVQLRTGEA